MLVLNSEITIGAFTFSGVHEVRINRSIHSLVETALIRIPARARIIRGGSQHPENVVTATQFAVGDKVTIRLGYNAEMTTEFTGFVRGMNQEMPLEVACEGYSWLLRRNKVNFSEQQISLSGFLKKAVAGTAEAVEVICNTSLMLNNVQVNGNGLDAIAGLLKYTDNAISCFFIAPGKLWCGPVYNSSGKGEDVIANGSAAYSKGFNVTREGSLKWREKVDLKVEVAYSKSTHNGTRIKAASTVYKETNHREEAVLNHIADETTLRRLADEKACRLSYTGYEGYLKAFLQPYAAPGFLAEYTDADYPERKGTYLVESTEVIFGITGARRKIEPGPRQGFLNETR